MSEDDRKRILMERLDEPRKGKRIKVYGGDAIVEHFMKDGTRRVEILKNENE